MSSGETCNRPRPDGLRPTFGKSVKFRVFVWSAAAAATVLASSAAFSQEAKPEEVVVTARKRVESLQDVPLAVTVLDGSSLQENRINTVDDLYGRVPGLYFSNSGGVTPNSDFIYLVLRGVGFNGGQEPATGVFIDGMYQPQLGYDLGFLDLERLEVLRGPQGTLFGRNTEAGAINLVTVKPDQTFAGRAELEGARFNTYRALAAIRGPLSDKVFAGFTGEYRETDGYMTNVALGEPAGPQRRYALRGTGRWLPTDQIDVVLAVDYANRRGNEMDYGGPLSCRCYDLQQDPRREDTQLNEGVQLTVDWRPSDALSLTSITGYRRVKTDTAAEFDGVQTDQTPVSANGPSGSPGGIVTFQGDSQFVNTDQRFWSEELRLAGNTKHLDWLLGAYYFNQKQTNFAEQSLGPGVVTDPSISFLVPLFDRLDFSDDRKGWALFGQVSWRPIDRLELTAGLRFSDETVSVNGGFFRNIVQIENDNPNSFRAVADKSFNDLSPIASVIWQFTDAIKGYATVSKGWKAGGFSRYPSTVSAVRPYDDETALNYEIGLKTMWPSIPLSVNLALFHIDIDDQQLFTTTNDEAGVPVSTITNAGRSRSQGAELEIIARPVPQLDLSISLAYTDTEFVDFTQRAVDGSFVVRDGQPFDFVPKITAMVGAEYRLWSGDDKELTLAASYQYVDDYVVPDTAVLAALGATIPVPSRDRTDVRLTFGFDDWKITGYVRNALDSYDYSNVFYRPFLAETPGNLLVRPLEPRTYGLVVSKNF